jgi:CubicO group peptidase (beta-lactamase class C family)
MSELDPGANGPLANPPLDPVSSPGLVHPEEVLPRTLGVLWNGMQRGMQVGAQVYVRHRGQVIADFGLGLAGPDCPIHPDTIMPWRSAGKPITAVAIGQCWEHGLLEIDDPVALHIPEFGARGKSEITIRHLLTHTSGIPAMEIDWYRLPWEQVISRICYVDYPDSVRPGTVASYVPYATWFLLGEILRRCDGRWRTGQDHGPDRRSVDAILEHRIFGPLGMVNSSVGIPLDRQRQLGATLGRMIETAPNQPDTPRVADWDTHLRTACINPAGNTRGPVRELGLFYQALLDHGVNATNTARILRGPTVEALTTRQREGMMDTTMRHRMDWALGFIADSNRYGMETVPYGHGRHASPRSYGHGGMQCATAFADPEHGIVVAASFAGLPGEPRHNTRVRDLNSAIYEDLGLIGSARMAPQE